MKRLGVLLVVVTISAAIGAFALHAARAQTLPATRGSVEARIAALEQKIAVLESQNAELRSVIQLSPAAGAITINSKGQLVLKGMSVVLESNGSADIKSAGVMTLKGALINLN